MGFVWYVHAAHTHIIPKGYSTHILSTSFRSISYRYIMSPTTIQSKAVNLVSVNTAPDRAKKVIGAVIENVRDRYDIVHAGNSISKSSVSTRCSTDRKTFFCDLSSDRRGETSLVVYTTSSGHPGPSSFPLLEPLRPEPWRDAKVSLALQFCASMVSQTLSGSPSRERAYKTVISEPSLSHRVVSSYLKPLLSSFFFCLVVMARYPAAADFFVIVDT